MKPPLCPCVSCEIDREKGRKQYRLRFADGSYYSPIVGGGDIKATRAHAPIVGERHARAVLSCDAEPV